MAETPFRRRTVDLIYEHVRDQIVSGALPPGQRVDQGGLAQRLRVSRTPVREAMLRLVVEGFLDHEPYRGAVVVDTDLHLLQEVTALRVHLEGLAARLGAANVTDEALAVMTRAVDELDSGADHERRAILNRQFHKALYDCAGSSQLTSFVELLGHHSQRIRLHYPMQRLDPVNEQHHAILDACRHHDPEQAEIATRLHIVDVFAELVRQSYLTSQTLDSGLLRAVLTPQELRQLQQISQEMAASAESRELALPTDKGTSRPRRVQRSATSSHAHTPSSPASGTGRNKSRSPTAKSGRG